MPEGDLSNWWKSQVAVIEMPNTIPLYKASSGSVLEQSPQGRCALALRYLCGKRLSRNFERYYLPGYKTARQKYEADPVSFVDAAVKMWV